MVDQGAMVADPVDTTLALAIRIAQKPMCHVNKENMQKMLNIKPMIKV